MVPLTYASYFDERLVLLFVEQPKGVIERIRNGQCNANFVFKDMNWRDLVFRTSQLASWPIDQLDEKKFKVEKKGAYEIYLDISEIEIREEGIPVVEIKVDGKRIVLGDREIKQSRKEYIRPVKYIMLFNRMKIGEIELESGRHIVEIESRKLKVEGDKEKHEQIKLILINKRKRQRLKKIICEEMENSENEVAYIFEKEKGDMYIP